MGATGRSLRKLGAMAASGVLLTGLAVGPATATVRLVDLQDGYGSGSYGSIYGGYGSDDQQGSSSSTTADSQPATDGESRGVALIDTESYDGSQAAGTGIVLTADGKLLTNYHVVEGSTSIKVTIASTGKTYAATLVGADSSADVAVLHLKNASGLKTAAIDNDTLAVGDQVTAVGNAGGTGSLSAADGAVTALGAQITTAAEGAVKGETLTKMIETDADVVAGDSGGPLLDDEGEVVGIDTAASSGTEIDGYAIPIDSAIKIADRISAGQETDQVRIGPAAYLGVQVTDSASSSANQSSGTFGNQDGFGNGFGDGLGTSNGTSNGTGNGPGTDSATASSGAAVAEVEDGAPAADGGLAAGDVITELGPTSIASSSELTSAIAQYQPGDRVKITWTDSSGAEQSATVTLGSSPIN